jgi:hypothetical protein
MNPLTQSKRTPILPLLTALTMARRALALAASLGLLLGVALPATAKIPFQLKPNNNGKNNEKKLNP